MSGVEIGLWSLLGILGLIWLGMHVSIALALTSFLGIWALRDSPQYAARMMALATRESISSYLFGVVPLFVLMGLVVSRADIGRDTFDVANRALGRLKGGLGMATVGANAVFAAITGISIASAAVFAKVAVPEMIRIGHTARFATGVVAGSSVLGMLIPPSLLLILYGILSEQSVGLLFVAGIGPGLLLALAYIAGIALMVRLWPGFTGTPEPAAPVARDGSLARDTASKLAPIAALIALVLGGIYGGVFTPTEAGAIGALGAIVIAAAKRRIGWRVLWQVTLETGHITASICFLIIAATMYSRFLALSGLPAAVTEWAVSLDLGTTGFVLIFCAILVLMGTILDSSSIMMITLPLVLPIARALDVDLIWFGIVTVLAVEIGLLTPPLGLSVFVIKGSLDDPRITLGDVFKGALPFAAIMGLVLLVLIVFPAIATGLL
ncbi:MAG: TRAP transporter large permease [Rhodobacter sp.]|uniref:TRAP transporter large permease n=1 Tax=Pararhodobacter sp. TaxID=2127056 RepID=UPI001D2F848F|nr:TRAP transporter large permease [Pararhodobacter sp.]MCB1346494.1 TRAP transporter large permease [Paracoccaceae bacterium]MCC0073119.1 TRAP transporter large permease [Rhodobacter sp.]HPD91116.1 TRAP transporter large permease [Pararhodobacter sp.]